MKGAELYAVWEKELAIQYGMAGAAILLMNNGRLTKTNVAVPPFFGQESLSNGDLVSYRLRGFAASWSYENTRSQSCYWA